jgi:hypothetical protein
LAELSGPVHLLTHVVDDLGEIHQVLHAGAKAGSLGSVGQRVTLEVLILDDPVSAVEHFLGSDGSREDLGKELVGVERDRSDEIVEAKRGGLRLGLPTLRSDLARYLVRVLG